MTRWKARLLFRTLHVCELVRCHPLCSSTALSLRRLFARLRPFRWFVVSASMERRTSHTDNTGEEMRTDTQHIACMNWKPSGDANSRRDHRAGWNPRRQHLVRQWLPHSRRIAQRGCRAHWRDNSHGTKREMDGLLRECAMSCRHAIILIQIRPTPPV